ncbi:MAG: molybdenum cofactor guanylyltransferase [Rhodospirillaceae bacterium]
MATPQGGPPAPEPDQDGLLHGLILAGGKSRRMGELVGTAAGAEAEAKPLLSLQDGTTLLDSVLDHLGPQITGDWCLSTGPAGPTYPRIPTQPMDGFEPASGRALIPIPDQNFALGSVGPLGGLLSGLEAVAAFQATSQGPNGPSVTVRVLSIPADTPFPPQDLVQGLQAAARQVPSGAAVARSAGRVHPLIGLWPIHLAPLLRRFLIEDGHRAAMAWVERCGAAVRDWPVPDEGPDPFLNINRAEDLALARQWFVRLGRAAQAAKAD